MATTTNLQSTLSCLKAALECLNAVATEDCDKSGVWFIREAAHKCRTTRGILLGEIGEHADHAQQVWRASSSAQSAIREAAKYQTQNPLVEDAMGFIQDAVDWMVNRGASLLEVPAW